MNNECFEFRKGRLAVALDCTCAPDISKQLQKKSMHTNTVYFQHLFGHLKCIKMLNALGSVESLQALMEVPGCYSEVLHSRKQRIYNERMGGKKMQRHCWKSQQAGST